MLKMLQTRKTPRRDPQAGVTLIEMMIVLVIIGIVAALVVPNVIGRPDQARVAVAKADLGAIAASLEMYRLDNRSYPTAAQGLAALSSPPTVAPLPVNWIEGGYLPNLPQDPWGNDYVYTVPGQTGSGQAGSGQTGSGQTGAFGLMSFGADGAAGGEGVDADIFHAQGSGA